MAISAVALLAAAVTGCGSTTVRTETVSRTVTQTVAAAPTAPTTATATGTQPTATTSAPEPALSGTYTLTADGSGDVELPTNPHDGLAHVDLRWIGMSGTCSGQRCQVMLRRVLSDNTIETLTLTSDKPAGVYTGDIPGGDGHAGCGGRVTLSMIVRVGGLQNIGGRTVATRLAGHIFGKYSCPGQAPTTSVATYSGVRS
jgi:hypothetical protein